MQHLKYDLDTLRAGSVVVVTMKNQANVLLMDAANHRTYSSGRGGRYRYTGGLAKRSPVRLQVPSTGHWFVAIDLGGASARISASVAVEPPPRGALPPIRDSADVLRQIKHGAPEPPPADVLGGRTWDVFVSHASEDKVAIARPLAEALREHGVSVWLDEVEMKIGDSLRRKIDQGIRSSRFGVVIFSEQFFAKGWTQYELDGLVTRTVSGEQNLLPIWHGVTKADVMRQSPSLADKVALSTSVLDVEAIALEIAEVVLVEVEGTG
jgi:hypothetical protein